MDTLKAFPRFPRFPFSGTSGNASLSRDSRQPYRWRERRECRDVSDAVSARAARRLVARLTVSLVVVVLAPTSAAETTTFFCRYARYVDDVSSPKVLSPSFDLTFVVDSEKGTAYVVGNNGSSEVSLTPGDGFVSFTEVTKSGSVQTTSVDATGVSVHSRHTNASGRLIPSQYYGKCVLR
jgi:hypothetical protein